MESGTLAHRAPKALLLGIVLFAFWRPLFAGATLAPVDQVWRSEPFASIAPDGLSIEPAPVGALGLHAAWAGGRTAIADGIPVTHLAYSVLPAWFAPGAVAAMAVALAMAGARSLAARRGAPNPVSSIAGLAYGASGLMFVSIGWHRATALALVPWVWLGLLNVAAAEGTRRMGALATAVAALAWCGVLSLTVIGVVGGLVLVGLDGRARLSGAIVRRIVAGTFAGLAVASPHLAAVWSLNGWAAADIGANADTSAQWETSLTVVAGSLFGNEAVGLPWFAEGTFHESVVFVGVVVLGLAVFGLAVGPDAYRSWSPGLIVLITVGAAVTWIGGPFEAALDVLAGDEAVASDARVLIVLPIALAAADGGAAILGGPGERVARAARRMAVILGCLAAGAVAALGRWVDLADGAGLARQASAEAWASLLVAVVAGVVICRWWTSRLAAVAAVWMLGVLVAFELLRFGMPIPTAASRKERLVSTSSHAAIAELLGSSGEHNRAGLVAGTADVLSPLSTDRFGLNDIRSPSRRSEAVLALFEAADPASTRLGVGGSPRAPFVSSDAADSGVWAAFGADVWVGRPTDTPPGRRIPPGISSVSLDPVAEPLFGSFRIPPEGVRAVELEFATTGPVEIGIEVSSGTEIRRNQIVARPGDGRSVVVPVLAETLPAGPAQLTVRVRGEPGIARLGVQETGAVAPGLILGEGGDSELVSVDPILIVHRPTPSARWATQFVVEPDIAKAAALVHSRRHQASVVLDRAPWDEAHPPSAAVISYQTLGERADLSVDAAGYGILVLDIVEAPGWTVHVDGHAVEPLTADAAFLAVPLGPGRYQVSIDHREPLGRWPTVVSTISLLAVVWWFCRSPDRTIECCGVGYTRW